MDFFIALFEFFERLLWGSPEPGVSLAIAPAAIMLGAGLVGGGINYLAGGKERRRLRRQANADRKRANQAFTSTQESISRLMGAAESINTNASTEELYGGTIDDLTNRINAGQSASIAALGRAGSAKGGDVTGTMNTAIQRIMEGGNRSLMDIMNQYNEKTDRYNLSQQNQKNQLLSNISGSRQSLLAMMLGQQERSADRSAEKNQADKQFLLDSIGAGASAASIFA